MNPIDLTPRAIAVLCSLRRGPLNARQLCSKIGDETLKETRDLLSDMSAGHERRPEFRLPGDMLISSRGGSGIWYLDHDGLRWLESHGLVAVASARVWNASDASSSGARSAVQEPDYKPPRGYKRVARCVLGVSNPGNLPPRRCVLASGHEPGCSLDPAPGSFISSATWILVPDVSSKKGTP